MEVQHFRRGDEESFLPALEKALGSPADFPSIRDAARAHAGAVIERHRHGWPPNRAPGTLEFVALMIGAWRALRPERDDAAIRGVLEAALRLGFGALTHKVRAGLEASPDPFAALVDVSREREAEFFGDGFVFERAVESRESYHLHVTRCWFVDVARVEGALAVAPALCAFDRVWFEAIAPDRHGVRFTRPTTIAGDGDRCRFHFDRVRS